MTDDSRSDIESLFHRARALPPSECSAFLDEACGDDETELPAELSIEPCEPGAKP